MPRADVGQGIASTQAMLIAEELDIDPATATLDPGQPHQAYFNAVVAAESLPFPAWDHGFVASTVRDLMGQVARLTSSQFTGGSSSTADLHETLRLAGATARETLKAAASARTGVPRADLRTEDGQVVLPDGTRIPYTELAGEAAAIDPITDVTLRPASDWTRLGKPYQRLDIVAKSTGTQDYGIDVVLPGMLHATVRANPGRGGGMASYSADAALAMQGVRSVVEVNEGLAVIADNTWFAFKAAEALEVDWLPPDYPASSAEMWQALADARTDEFRNSRLRDDGDVEAALDGATVIEAEYRAPFLAHAALEPLSATVLVEAERVQIWTATQVPTVVRDAAVEITGLDPSQVTLHVLPAGGSFGRRLDHDYVVQAIQIAASMPGTPIKTTWSREEDMTHDYPRPLHMAVGRGAVADGRVLAYDLDSVSPSLISSWFGRIFIVPPGPDTMLVWGAFDQPYAIPNYRVTGYAAPPLMPVGSWRSPGACSNSFFHESFLSELIHAAGADPLEERLRLIADPELAPRAGGRGRDVELGGRRYRAGTRARHRLRPYPWRARGRGHRRDHDRQGHPHRRGLDRRRLRHRLRPRQRRGATDGCGHLRTGPRDELRTHLREPRGAADQLPRFRGDAPAPDAAVPHATAGPRRAGPWVGRARNGPRGASPGRCHLCRDGERPREMPFSRSVDFA